MKKVMIIFVSMTGNTELMAYEIGKGAQKAKVEVDIKNAMEVYATDLLQYDGFMIGAYTWGEGELPEELLDFYEELDEVDLSGKKCAVFGSGSSQYEYYGRAVDILAEKLEERGAEMIQTPLKVDSTPNEKELVLCSGFGQQFARVL